MNLTELPVRFCLDDGSPIYPEDKACIIGEDMTIAVLDKGTVNGHPSIMLKVSGGQIPPHLPAICQTTARLFVTAARLIEAKYPDLFKDN